MTVPYRVFYAHRKDAAEPAKLREDAEAVRVFLQAVIGPERAVSVTIGYDDYEAHFRRCGGWSQWMRDVALGTVYGTGALRYHAIVTPDEVVSRATASLIELALGAAKPVLLWTAASAETSGVGRKVVRIDRIEGGSMQADSRVRT